MGEELNKPFFFPKDVYRRSLFFSLALRARSRVSRSLLHALRCFRKKEGKNKTTSVYRLDSCTLPLRLAKYHGRCLHF